MNLRYAQPGDNKLLAQLHISVFPGFFLSTLGERFLTAYYKIVLKHPETICLFAIDENNKVCGYVLGRTNAKGYLKRIVKSAPFVFCSEGIRLLFTRPKALLRLVNNLEKKRDDETISDDQNYAEIGLIGVLPNQKGQGIGRQMLNKFEEILKEKGVMRLSLTTDAIDNENTLKSYEAWGFEVFYQFTSYPDRKMYRLIKNI